MSKKDEAVRCVEEKDRLGEFLRHETIVQEDETKTILYYENGEITVVYRANEKKQCWEEAYRQTTYKVAKV